MYIDIGKHEYMMNSHGYIYKKVNGSYSQICEKGYVGETLRVSPTKESFEKAVRKWHRKYK